MRALILSAILALLAAPAAAQSWQQRYSAGNGAGEIDSCNAGIRYAGAAFATRIYGPSVDLYVQSDGVRLPVNRALGIASLQFDGAGGRRVVTMRAHSYPEADPGRATTSAVILTPVRAQQERVLALLAASRSATLRYTDGRVLTVGLNGSSRAIDAARACRATFATGPVGGSVTVIAKGRF